MCFFLPFPKIDCLIVTVSSSQPLLIGSGIYTLYVLTDSSTNFNFSMLYSKYIFSAIDGQNLGVQKVLKSFKNAF